MELLGGRRRRNSPLASVGHTPDPRTSFANERTFLAWIRTSLSLLVAGVAVSHLLPETTIPFGGKLIGVPLVVFGAIIGVQAYDRWDRSERALRMNVDTPRTALLPMLSYGIAAVGLISIIISVFYDGPGL
jgi:putative membrane protein